MSQATIWLVVAAVAVGGFALRAAFIVVPLMPRDLPPRVELVLGLVPAAAFAALLAPSLFLDDGHLRLISPASLAAGVALLVSFKWNSLALSIISGLASYALFDVFL
ncbi:AzlD domain-containing protein [Mycolicibacterium mengxianglii]|uniref:AzlD domain-containing protein n=1 Tax=Mycolicibacterium mengxianglii TaxID=2736649 RepID=UPI0018D17BA7|nr:AzlD domain-containing protein [Mycolicibacterium mengxianglii]